MCFSSTALRPTFKADVVLVEDLRKKEKEERRGKRQEKMLWRSREKREDVQQLSFAR